METPFVRFVLLSSNNAAAESDFMNKKLPAITALLVLLFALSFSAAGQRTRDVIVVTKPRLRNERQRHIELSDENGLVGGESYTYLDFKYNRKIYSAWWESRTTAPPANLSDEVSYKFLIRIDRRKRTCEIVKIWEGKKLLWSNPKLAKRANRQKKFLPERTGRGRQAGE